MTRQLVRRQISFKLEQTHWRRSTDTPSEIDRGAMEKIHSGSHRTTTSEKSRDNNVQRVLRVVGRGLKCFWKTDWERLPLGTVL